MIAKPIRAVYESGQLRLLEPADLAEGETISVTITPEKSDEMVDLSQPRIAGLHAGEIWTSDDFDDPLPDEFWLGEE